MDRLRDPGGRTFQCKFLKEKKKKKAIVNTRTKQGGNKVKFIVSESTNEVVYVSASLGGGEHHRLGKLVTLLTMHSVV